MEIFRGIVRSAAKIVRSPHLLQVRLARPANVRKLQDLIQSWAEHGQRTFLITRIARLGDILAAEPLSRSLKTLYPECRLIWCVRAEFENLVRRFPAVDATLAVSCLTEAMDIGRTGLFDKVFELHFEGDYCRACKRPLRHRAGGDPSLSMSNYTQCRSLLEAFGRAAGIPVHDQQPVLPLPDTAVRTVDRLQLPRPYLAVHCLSAEPKKNWSKENWRALVARLSNGLKMNLVEIGLKPLGAAEKNAIDLCGKLSLLEAAEVIRRASLFVGPDSGPAHLANAMQTKGVVLLSDVPHLKGFIPFSGKYADPAYAVKLPLNSGGRQLEVPVVVEAIRTILAG